MQRIAVALNSRAWGTRPNGTSATRAVFSLAIAQVDGRVRAPVVDHDRVGRRVIVCACVPLELRVPPGPRDYRNEDSVRDSGSSRHAPRGLATP
jgi:hypothetical protein